MRMGSVSNWYPWFPFPSLRPGRYCSTRHRMPFDSGNDGQTCVSMTRRAKGRVDMAWLTMSKDAIQFNSRNEGTKRVTWRAMRLADIVRHVIDTRRELSFIGLNGIL